MYNMSGFKSFGKCNDQYRVGGVICFVDCLFEVNPLVLDMVTADALLLVIIIIIIYYI